MITVEDEPQIVGSTGLITPRDVQKAVQWVRLNKAALLEVWSQRASHDDFKYAKV